MSPFTLALLIFSLLIAVICSIGVLLMQGVYDKLHYLAPVSILSTGAIAAAVGIESGFLSQSSIKSFLVFVVFLISGPVITQAAARAEFLREKRAGKSGREGKE